MRARPLGRNYFAFLFHRAYVVGIVLLPGKTEVVKKSQAGARLARILPPSAPQTCRIFGYSLVSALPCYRFSIFRTFSLPAHVRESLIFMEQILQAFQDVEVPASFAGAIALDAGH